MAIVLAAHLAALVGVPSRLGAQPPEEKVLAGWTFDRPGDLEGWQGNAHLTDVSVSGGALQGRAIDWDPQFVSPWLEIPTAALQRIEVRMKSSRGGLAQLFWAPAKTGKYEGFDPDKVANFDVIGDDAKHTYVILPFWQDDPVVYRLRIDPAGDATVAVDSVRIVGPAASGLAPVPPRWEFDSGGDLEGWRSAEGQNDRLRVVDGCLHVEPGPTMTLAAPPADIDPLKVEWVSIRLRSDGEGVLSAWWLGPATKGMGKRGAALIGDSEMHTYNTNVGGVAGWWARPTQFGLQLPPRCKIDIDWVRVGELPDGGPELGVQVLSPVRAINREGEPFEVACEIVNRGGRLATGVTAEVILPEVGHIGVVKGPAPLAPVRLGEPQRLVWTLKSDAAFDGVLEVLARAPGAQAGRAKTVVSITPRPDVPRADYVPEPKPPRTDYNIGVYYFPGWWDWSRWEPIRRFPERTPVLGFYQEGDPQVADWHIKYAAEHGVRFFAYDWYWRDGKEDLGHALTALRQARHRKYLKYCFLYANHPPFNIHDRAELMTITRYWLDRYFTDEQFYTIDGKPVIIVFWPQGFSEVLGEPAAVRSALDESRGLAQQRGLPGIYYMCCEGPGRAILERRRDEGYDAVTAYTYPAAGAEGDNRAPYSKMVDGFAAIWDDIIGQGVVKYVIPVAPGWDSRPWGGEGALARPGNTPDQFRRMLRLAKERVDREPEPRLRTVIVEAWNEWGEGAICEPELRYGFGQLDAIREVFCPGAGPHLDLAPSDVGLPFIESPEPPPIAGWAFRAPEDAEGWTSAQTEGLRVEDGRLVMRTTGGDPTLLSPTFGVWARDCPKVVIRMMTSQDTEAQLFWQTAEADGMGEPRSIHFPVRGGVLQSYELPVSQSPHWFGRITRLRLDPGFQADMDVAIADIRLQAGG
jgi:Glycosyltransferase WbsX